MFIMGIVKSLESFSSGLHSVISASDGGWLGTFIVGSYGDALNSVSDVSVSLDGGLTFAVSVKVPDVSLFGARSSGGGAISILDNANGFILGYYTFFVIGLVLEDGASVPTLLVDTYYVDSDGAPDMSSIETYRASVAVGSTVSVVISGGSGVCRGWVNSVKVIDRSASGFSGDAFAKFDGSYLMYGCMQLVPYDYTLLGFSYYGRMVTDSEVGGVFALTDSILVRPLLSTISSTAHPASGSTSTDEMGYFPMSYETSYSALAPGLVDGGLWYLAPPRPDVSYSSRDGSYYVWRYSPLSSAPLSGLTFYSRADCGDSVLEVESAVGAVGSADVKIGSLSSPQVSPCMLSIVSEATVYGLEYELKDGSGGDTIFMRPSSEATLGDYVSTYIVGRGSVSGAEVSREEVSVKVLMLGDGGADKAPSNPLIDRTWCSVSINGSLTEASDGHYRVFTDSDFSTIEAVGDYGFIVGGVSCFVSVASSSSLPYARGCAELGAIYNGELLLCSRPLYVDRGWRQETRLGIERTDGQSSWVIPVAPTPAFAKFKFMLTVSESLVAGSDLSLSSATLVDAIHPTITYAPLSGSAPVLISWEFSHPSSDLLEYVMNVLGYGTTPWSGGFIQMKFVSSSALAEGQSHVNGTRLISTQKNESTSSVSVNYGSYSGRIPIGGGSLTPSAPSVTRTLTWSSGSTSTESVAYTVSYVSSQYVGPLSGYSVDSGTGKITVPSMETYLLPSGESGIAVIRVSVLVDGESSSRVSYVNARYTGNTSISVKLNSDVSADAAVCPWTIGSYGKSALSGVSSLPAKWNPQFKVDVTFTTSGAVVSQFVSDWEASGSSYGIGSVLLQFSWHSATVRLIRGGAAPNPTVTLSVPDSTYVSVEDLKVLIDGTWGSGLLWYYGCGCGWSLRFRDISDSTSGSLSGEVDEGRTTAIPDAACLFVNGLQ